MLDGLKISREAIERTVRLVTTARLRDSVLLDLVNESELEALSEIEGATSTRRIAQARGAGEVQSHELVYGVPHAHFINASFAYAKPREPNRFNGADRGAWYAGFEVETSLAEVKFHLTEALAVAGENGWIPCWQRAGGRSPSTWFKRDHLSICPQFGRNVSGRAFSACGPIGGSR
jgi:hypothetical protein